MPVWQNLRNNRTSFRIKNILVKEFIFVYKTCGLGRFHVIQNWLLSFFTHVQSAHSFSALALLGRL